MAAFILASVPIRMGSYSQNWVSEERRKLREMKETQDVNCVECFSKWTLTIVLSSFVPPMLILRILPVSVPVSHGTHSKTLSGSLVPLVLSFLGDGWST